MSLLLPEGLDQAVALLIDVSGSMHEIMPMLKRELCQAVDTLATQQTAFNLIAFNEVTDPLDTLGLTYYQYRM